MSILGDALKMLGIPASRKSRRSSGPLGLPPLPSPDEVQDVVGKLVEGASKLKEIPKDLADRVSEASQDFQTADDALRGARIKTGRSKK